MSELAIKGGQPVITKPVPAWPTVTSADEQALLNADTKTKNGPECQRFAKRFEQYCDVKHCIPVANGTVSLELIMRGLGIGYGDEVILPPYTFIASMSSIVFACATPVFADIDPLTYNINPEKIEEKITSNTKAIVAVAVGGRPCDYEKLEAIAKKHNLYLILDAAQAVGARFNNKSIGTIGTAASFSLQNSKNLTCGEGGLITTNSDELYENICAILGLNDKEGFPHLDHGLTEIQAALLNSQFDKLEDEIILRSRNSSYLEGLLKDNEFIQPAYVDDRAGVNACHVYIFKINYKKLEEYGLTKSDYIDALAAEGFQISHGYFPLYGFDCTQSDLLIHSIGTKIDCSELPECQIASFQEGAWIYHALFLQTREDMDKIAEAINKVNANIEELRK